MISPEAGNSADRLLSPRELATAIGVSESSLKRWVDEGVLSASRTVGKHRRISLGEAIRFIRARRMPLVRPDLLGFPDFRQTIDRYAQSTIADQLYSYLRSGNAAETRRLLIHAFMDGMSIADIADGPLKAALTGIGELWLHQSEGIFFEHRATDICLQALHQLQTLLVPPENAPVAIGGSAPGDLHQLPSLLASMTLADTGYGTVNLGGDSPFEALVHAAEHHPAKLCWISYSTPRAPQQVAREVNQLASRLAELQVHLVAGGSAVEHARLAPHANLTICNSMNDLSQIGRKGLAA